MNNFNVDALHINEDIHFDRILKPMMLYISILCAELVAKFAVKDWLNYFYSFVFGAEILYS